MTHTLLFAPYSSILTPVSRFYVCVMKALHQSAMTSFHFLTFAGYCHFLDLHFSLSSFPLSRLKLTSYIQFFLTCRFMNRKL